MNPASPVGALLLAGGIIPGALGRRANDLPEAGIVTYPCQVGVLLRPGCKAWLCLDGFGQQGQGFIDIASNAFETGGVVQIVFVQILPSFFDGLAPGRLISGSSGNARQRRPIDEPGWPELQGFLMGILRLIPFPLEA